MVRNTHHLDLLINLGIEVGKYATTREGPEEELAMGGLCLYMHGWRSYR